MDRCWARAVRQAQAALATTTPPSPHHNCCSQPHTVLTWRPRASQCNKAARTKTAHLTKAKQKVGGAVESIASPLLKWYMRVNLYTNTTEESCAQTRTEHLISLIECPKEEVKTWALYPRQTKHSAQAVTHSTTTHVSPSLHSLRNNTTQSPSQQKEGRIAAHLKVS